MCGGVKKCCIDMDCVKHTTAGFNSVHQVYYDEGFGTTDYEIWNIEYCQYCGKKFELEKEVSS